MVLAALIPALLFYVSLVLYADIGAAKSGLSGARKEDLIDWKKALKERGHLLIPIILLVVLIIYGWSPLKSAFWCVVLIIALSWTKKSTRISLQNIKDALIAGSKDTVPIAAACASAGIIVGVVSITGIGVKFSSLLMQLAANNVGPALVLTMVAALIMGNGLPPTAVYNVRAALTVPALVNMGIGALLSGAFLLCFTSPAWALLRAGGSGGLLSAAMAHTDPFKTGWAAFPDGACGLYCPVYLRL